MAVQFDTTGPPAAAGDNWHARSSEQMTTAIALLAPWEFGKLIARRSAAPARKSSATKK